MSVSLQIYLCFVAVGVFAVLANVAGNTKRIADKISLRESQWAKGYLQGYEDAKRWYCRNGDGDSE